jgi:hypothetical protein
VSEGVVAEGVESTQEEFDFRHCVVEDFLDCVLLVWK